MNNDDTAEIRTAIIEKIRKNRISTTEIADCLGKTGAVPNIRPLNEGHHKVGRAELVYAYNESNWGLHKLIEDVPEDCILIVENHECGDKAIFGEIVAKYLTLYRGVNGLVVNGLLRDASILNNEDYPIWAKGTTPIGCFNKPHEEPLDEEIIVKWGERYEGAVIVCDDGGVVIIPKKDLTNEFLDKLEFIELQEDIWHYCVDTKKWSTYRTICKKDYLDTELLPNELSEKFEEFVKWLDLEES